jgi:hypothetical protein
VEWGMVIMGYVQVRLKYPDVFQPAHKTDSTSLLKNLRYTWLYQYRPISRKKVGRIRRNSYFFKKKTRKFML